MRGEKVEKKSTSENEQNKKTPCYAYCYAVFPAKEK
jgi:hypothetical protein